MASYAATYRGALSPFRGLGACWIVYGVLRLCLSIWLATFTPVATVMFGALLVRVADPYSLMAAFHVFYLFAIILSAVCGIFAFLAGLALLSAKRAGRALALIAAFLSLSELPIGTTLGVYTLVTLLPFSVAGPAQTLAGGVETYPSAAR
jgi:hypothetical protein